MTAMTRGPLPARVYWTRRILVIGVALGLVLAVVQLASLALGGGSEEPDQAVQVAVETEPQETPTAEATDPAVARDDPDQDQGQGKGKKDRKRDRDTEPVLAAPEGPCVDRDIAVTPTAEDTVAGDPITFVLELRTILTEACTWEVSSESLTVKITSGDDDIWSSRECPGAIAREDVVLRNNVSTQLKVTWSARRSDEECSRLTDWAMPGWYFIEAAALAGEPSDLQFQLTAPEPEVVTETVEPDPKDDKKRDQTRGGRRSD